MKQVKAFLPFIAGLLLIALSYYFEQMITKKHEADTQLLASVSKLLEHKNIGADANRLLSESLNELVEYHHSQLKEGYDVLWAIGFLIILWSFPYQIFFKQDSEECLVI